MRDWSPGPADMRKASSAEKATTARKSRFAASGTWAGVQVTPASVVRRYVPCVPLAQATSCETALTPRRLSVVWEIWMRGPWAKGVAGRRGRARRRIGYQWPVIGGQWSEISSQYLYCQDSKILRKERSV